MAGCHHMLLVYYRLWLAIISFAVDYRGARVSCFWMIEVGLFVNMDWCRQRLQADGLEPQTDCIGSSRLRCGELHSPCLILYCQLLCIYLALYISVSSSWLALTLAHSARSAGIARPPAQSAVTEPSNSAALASPFRTSPTAISDGVLTPERQS